MRRASSKGALLLKTIGIPSARPTVDIDMLRKGRADHASLVALIKDCATLEVEADGLVFIADSVVAEDIAKDSEYKGTRVLMQARMDACVEIQIDFGVGDVMVPGPRMIEYPSSSAVTPSRCSPIQSSPQWRRTSGHGRARQRQHGSERDPVPRRRHDRSQTRRLR